MTVDTGPLLDEVVDAFPATQIEVADTEIGSFRDGERIPERREKLLIDVVENSRHAIVRCFDNWLLDRERRLARSSAHSLTSQGQGARLCRLIPRLKTAPTMDCFTAAAVLDTNMTDRTVVSVDLAHSSYANNGVVVLTEHEDVLRAELCEIPMHGVPDPKKLAAYAVSVAESVDAGLIFLDGPQGWRDPSEDVSELRVCERKLAAPAKTGLPGCVKPQNYTPFVAFSIAVFDALDSLGWTRIFDPQALGTARSAAVESFPLAAWRSLKIASLPAKAKAKPHDILERVDALNAFGVEIDGTPSHDQLQAVVAGLAGFPSRFDVQVSGVAPRLIEETWREGFIVCPKRSASTPLLEPQPQPRLFTIHEDRWYAWQMMPGYGGGGYYSPIHVERFRPLKTGRDLIQMSFFNAGYAEGVQGFDIKARVIKRAPDFLILDLTPNGQPERVAIVSEISLGWLRRFVPEMRLPDEPPDDLDDLLESFYLHR